MAQSRMDLINPIRLTRGLAFRHPQWGVHLTLETAARPRVLRGQRSSPSGLSEDSQSSIRGDRLEFLDQIRTRLHTGSTTESGDSGSPVYLVDKSSNREYLIGVHRSRHHEDAYAVPMAVILEYAAQSLDKLVDMMPAYTWRLTSVEDHN